MHYSQMSDADEFIYTNCTCGAHIGVFIDVEDATDALMEHVYEEGYASGYEDGNADGYDRGLEDGENA